MKSRHEKRKEKRNDINRQARPDLLNANALMKKAARNPESIADGGCTYVRMDGRTNGQTGGRTRWGERTARARPENARTTKRAKIRARSTGRWNDNRDSSASQLYLNDEAKNHPNHSLVLFLSFSRSHCLSRVPFPHVTRYTTVQLHEDPFRFVRGNRTGILSFLSLVSLSNPYTYTIGNLIESYTDEQKSRLISWSFTFSENDKTSEYFGVLSSLRHLSSCLKIKNLRRKESARNCPRNL